MKHKKSTIITLDFESILVPEIWIAVAEQAGIDELKLTTRDIPNYDTLMKKRINILAQNKISLKSIQSTVEKIYPLKGAREFLDYLRDKYQVIILSDTFYEFIMPLIKKLNYPTLFCHSLEVDKNGYIKNYKLRQSGKKENVVSALKGVGFNIVAIGDSYNDINMLKIANTGILFNASDKIVQEFSQFPAFNNYDALKNFIIKLEFN